MISRYLDKKTEQIDLLVEKIHKKIELLKEQRTSLINQCVTKGLNPNVEMKDSGVEWIGDIPSHWDVKKGKYILSILLLSLLLLIWLIIIVSSLSMITNMSFIV